nr:ribonuclease H-like domain-containing protein [Tanacetum cinerariifolium]
MTYTDKESDNVLNISHLKIKVGHPNETKAFISKIGNLKLSNGLVLYDVLVLPKYRVTLISIHKLSKENKIIVAFDESRCYFLNQDFNLRNVLGIGNQCEGLYYYNNQEPVLNVLKDSLQFDNKDQSICCETCQMAKQSRESFPLSDHTSNCLGIIHQTSRAYTPQQNRIAERKHREIPLKLWTECILTATYLLNRLPSSMLNEKSPYEMIYKKPPTLSYLRVFGCLCFATIGNNNDKLSS